MQTGHPIYYFCDLLGIRPVWKVMEVHQVHPWFYIYAVAEHFDRV